MKCITNRVHMLSDKYTFCVFSDICYQAKTAGELTKYTWIQLTPDTITA